MKKKVDFKPEKFELKRFAKNSGISDDALVEAITRGDNGLANLFEDLIECSTLDCIDRQVGFKKHLRKPITITIRDTIAKLYSKITQFRPGHESFIRIFHHHFVQFNDDLEKHGSDGATRRLHIKISKFKESNSPKFEVKL